MRFGLVATCLLAASCMAATSLPERDAAQRAHARGSCGSLGPGTGLAGGRGWIVSMMPGRHALRMRGEGEAFLTVARLKEFDFDAGRPYYIALEGTTAGSTLEWKVPGRDWAPVSSAFLYPPQGVIYAPQ